ncbi:hypothetical protein, partial [Paratractidigestivibacter sp.]|uniref:hypothetical protein n=1 Tax=Paratractidigestivibacter sp. TaxID=2847316 RepID=UPI00402785F8
STSNNAFPAPCAGIALAPELAAFAFAVCIQTCAWAHPSLQIHPSRCSSGQFAPLKFSQNSIRAAQIVALCTELD